LLHREFAYSLRVRLLEAVDGQRKQRRADPPVKDTAGAAQEPKTDAKASSAESRGAAAHTASATMEDWEEEEDIGSADLDAARDSEQAQDAAELAASGLDTAGAVDCGHCVDDLGRCDTLAP
jgi:hypothetical protein